MDQALSETKEALGIHRIVRLISDVSYFRYLAATFKNPLDSIDTLPVNRNAHGDVIRMFGAKHVSIDTTKSPGTAVSVVDPFENARALECALLSRCFVCRHNHGAVEPERCIEEVIRGEHYEPYILASMDENFYTQTQQRTGVPVLTVQNDKKTILIPPSSALGRIRDRRVAALEDREKRRIEKEADYQASLKESSKKKTQEKEAAKAGETSKKTTSKKGKGKQ